MYGQTQRWEDRQGCDQGPYLSSVSKESQMKETYHTPKQSKSRKLSSFNDLEDDSHSQTEDDSTYIEPLSSHHYHNWQIATGLSSDDDSHGYQNVIGTIKSNRLLVDEDIYENNLAIQIWKQAQISESDSVNCEEESIYINTEQYSSIFPPVIEIFKGRNPKGMKASQHQHARRQDNNTEMAYRIVLPCSFHIFLALLVSICYF
ncbi:linker for activation of T-cells family member 2 isoform X2 [Pituophis catenifer annectens]|uniref:linker for activation of T-cells family member 2 isoform X2 n=1 Tax=Pituophis catenifer annectens TaxID=94852 RepID=UPI0039942280